MYKRQVVESLAKLVAAGVDYKTARLSFQEYFEKLGKDSYKWSKPFLALLGAMKVQKDFDVAAIGGKDSMSGTFNDISVPPTLISFAVSPINVNDVLSTEFKKAKNKIYLVENFKKVTNDGGWNYNIKTGEIHANLPYNFFEQGIDWENY